MRLDLLKTLGAPKKPQNKKLKAAAAESRKSGAGQRAQKRGARGVLHRLGALVWPERFPDIAAARADRVRARRSTPKGFIWIWALAVTLAAAAFIAHLHIRFDIIQSGYSLSTAQAEQRRLRLAQRELRLELATLKEPGRIEEQARELLGMERPDHERIIRLDERGQRRSRRAARRR